MSTKVSIVVPTYAPGDRINGLVRSLEAQTMPTSDFEVIFIDDGSPDDTWRRLKRIRDSHDNVRIERIPNSGWPSRPRNVGLELARGDYVLFMDHDDEIYPRALEAGYAMAARTHADVLNGKETRTNQAGWALELYSANQDNVVDRTDMHPLVPTNPHKLFRRAMLMEHGIRFPEGRRVLWEDVFFAIDMAPYAKVISVLADTPFYHWVRGRVTASSSYGSDRREYFRWVREIILQTNEKLAGPGLEVQHRLMLLHQYRSRVLAQLGPALFAAPADEFADVRTAVEDLVTNHIPVELDSYLTPTQLGRAVLVRAGRWDLLEKYIAVDAGLVGIGTATSVRWVDGALHITAESRWTGTGGARLAVRFDGDRIVRELPDDVAAALPEAAMDLTAELHAARAAIGIRARDTAVNWMLPGTCEPRIDTIDHRPDLVVEATGVLDPRTAALGHPLEETSWDLTSRNELLGGLNQRGLRASTPTRSALRNGHVYIAYRNRAGMLSLDIDQTNRSLPGSARLDPKRVAAVAGAMTPPRWRRRRTFAATFELPFSGVATGDDTGIDGSTEVGNGGARPARIVARAGAAWLESSLEQPSGTYPLTLLFHGRRIDAGIDLTVDVDGTITAARHPS